MNGCLHSFVTEMKLVIMGHMNSKVGDECDGCGGKMGDTWKE